MLDKAITAIKEKLEEQEKRHPELAEADPVRERIDGLFEGKVGDPYPPDRLKQIYKDGAERYGQTPKVPPGYEDAKDKKGNDQYGDLIIWFQIIDKAVTEKKSVIFVTDDRKDDWWWKPSSRTFGPRPELVQEMSEKANVPFYMYQADRFLEFANQFLGQNVEQAAIDEIKQLREEEEAKELEVEAALQEMPFNSYRY